MSILVGVSKGALEKTIFWLLRYCELPMQKKRKYRYDLNGGKISFIILKGVEILNYIEIGRLDFGIVGEDQFEEYSLGRIESNSEVISKLSGSKEIGSPGRWVLAFHRDEDEKNIHSQLESGGLRIATEIPNITSEWVRRKGYKVMIEKSFGSTEVKVPLFADGIVDCVHTGATLEEADLIPYETVFLSNIYVIRNKNIDSDKMAEFECMVTRNIEKKNILK